MLDFQFKHIYILHIYIFAYYILHVYIFTYYILHIYIFTARCAGSWSSTPLEEVNCCSLSQKCVKYLFHLGIFTSNLKVRESRILSINRDTFLKGRIVYKAFTINGEYWKSNVHIIVSHCWA
jgi:hypothetical protein